MSGRYTVNYTESLQEMTKSLAVYDQMIQAKKIEKDELTEFIQKTKLDIKHAKEDSKKSKAIE